MVPALMLHHTAIFLAAAVVAVPLFRRLGLGSVLGYLAAGMVIGPSGLGLIHEVRETLHFAEFGVVLLLFLVGLELEPKRLMRMRGAVFGLGGAQVVLSAGAIFGAAFALGVPLQTAAVIGAALAMSSTAFAMQALGERNELGLPHGQQAFGILLFQDLAAIPTLALVPLLAPGNAESTGSPGTQALLTAAVIAGLVIAGRLLLRPAFRFVVEAKSHELSAASALLVVVATSLVMEWLGLSMALGAFLAGVLLADSEYKHELEANIEPFKGLLLGLFFIAVGMSANLSVFADRPLEVLALVIGLVFVKGAILFGVAQLARPDRRSSTRLAIAISQGGEFAFVIFGEAGRAGIIAPASSDLLVLVVTFSMAVTPLLFLLDGALEKRRARPEQRPFDAIPDERSRVIVAGFGRFGQVVARVLRLKRIRFTALDASATQVDFVRRFGNRIHYGDASRVELLRAAGAERAEIFVLAIDDVESSMRTLRVVQENFPHLTVVARARNRQHAYALLAAGVTHVIRETFAGSLEAARLTLEQIGLPPTAARETLRRFAERDEAMVLASYKLKDDEAALIRAAKEYSAELERIFEEDQRSEV